MLLTDVSVLSGSDWITTDLDFGRFTGLCWKHPLT